MAAEITVMQPITSPKFNAPASRESIALLIADQHLAIEKARQAFDIGKFNLDQLIRLLNNTPEVPAEAPTVTK